MSYTIHKFPLEITDHQVVKLSELARMLDVKMQNGRLCLWAITSPTAPQVERHIEVIGTGHPVHDPNTLLHIGTVLHSDLRTSIPFVWHVFERITGAQRIPVRVRP